MKRAQLEPTTAITIWRYVDRHRRRFSEPAGPCQTVGLFVGVQCVPRRGCVGVQKIPVDPALWSQKQTRIGVAMVCHRPRGLIGLVAKGCRYGV